MSEVENQAILRRYYAEVVNGGNLAVVDELIAPGYVSHHNDPLGLPPGPDGVKQFIAGTRAGFPDLQITVEDMFADGDNVAARWTMRGTQTGQWFDIPPTGKKAPWVGVVINRFAGGKIAEDWYNFDQLSLLMQLGIIPAPS